ncbi:MAG TPA: carboxypeptidase regulatory-like domain-containing protein [Isosphaeraceae bacterium]|nr:carboxypeptidase regulatory-like domain-containing protein [Isosphaeraceae bacterium]
MTTRFGPLLAAALLAQFQGGTLQGTVVDGQGKPVAEVQVVLYSPPGTSGNGDPAEVKARTDGQGRFVLKASALGEVHFVGVHVWAYKPGLAIAAVPYQGSRAPALALQKYDPRTVKVEGPDGQPVAGARVSPRAIFIAAGDTIANVPEALAVPLAVTTRPDGTAAIAYLRGRDQLVAARITADAIGTQDLLIVDRPRQSTVEPTIAIRLKKTSRLAGKVIDQNGRGIADRAVEVWSKGIADHVLPNHRLDFKNGPVRTSADGSFQTPETLMAGSTYRVVVRGEDGEPTVSDWITMAEKPVTLAPLELRPPRTIAGRLVDRQGKPVADAEVFRSGDGSKRTSAKTDVEGRFSLGGIRRGPVFVFVRAAGFRFHGQLLEPGESSVTVELTRTTERPAREMKTLPDPIPLQESRALARRLLDPWWQAAAERGDDNTRAWVLRFMVPADPVGVLQRLEMAKLPDVRIRSSIQSMAARALADTELEEAVAVAESIADAGTRAGTLARLSDRLPGTQRERKLALLDRAAVHAKGTIDPSDHVRQLGEVAVRLYELGEVDKAKALFAEGVRLARQLKDKSLQSSSFAGRLARVDLPEALALAKPLKGEGFYGARIAANIAFDLAWDNPADARRFLDQYPVESVREWLFPVVTWKVAALDPARARQLVEGQRGDSSLPEHELCLALGAKGRDEPASRQAIATALHDLDRLMQDQPQQCAQVACRLLPIAEAIDPALVPELFWRALAARQSPVWAMYLAWYNRDVAAALFEPARQRLGTSGTEPGASQVMFEAWSLFDPRAAVARLEKVPMPSLDPNDNRARIAVIKALSLAHDERWRRTWPWWEPIFNPSNRDVFLDRF